jgi:hypothetical protein
MEYWYDVLESRFPPRPLALLLPFSSENLISAAPTAHLPDRNMSGHWIESSTLDRELPLRSCQCQS